MFERYSERARRAVFFARYEAAQAGSAHITVEYLLLGLLREDNGLRRKLGAGGDGEVRRYVEERCPPAKRRISVSVDLPLDALCKHALNQAAREADALGQREITPDHLTLAVLQADTSVAAQALRARGVEYQSYRESVASSPPAPPVEPFINLPWPDSEPAKLEVAALQLRDACNALACLVDSSSPELDAYSEADGYRALGSGQWLRKEALGHLIDWACSHQQWFARALTDSKLAANGYPGAEWITAQNYRNVPWPDLTDVWVNLNRLLVQVIAQVPEAKLATPCHIGLQEAIPLEQLILNYVKYCQEEMAEILTRP